jgi:hypothetical protein
MQCSQCSNLMAADAKFCSNCGKPLSEVLPGNSNNTPTSKAAVAKPGRFVLLVVGSLLAFGYALMFVSAFEGRELTPELGAGFTFWTAVWFYYFWKRRALSGWHGALIGTGIGLILFFAVAFFYGFMHGGTAN